MSWLNTVMPFPKPSCYKEAHGMAQHITLSGSQCNRNILSKQSNCSTACPPCRATSSRPHPSHPPTAPSQHSLSASLALAAWTSTHEHEQGEHRLQIIPNDMSHQINHSKFIQNSFKIHSKFIHHLILDPMSASGLAMAFLAASLLA